MGIPFQETIFETNLLNLIVVIYIVVTVVGEALTRELETRQKKVRERYKNSL
jgi:F0F1-type ATP synthase membrane subunit b/b'